MKAPGQVDGRLGTKRDSGFHYARLFPYPRQLKSAGPQPKRGLPSGWVCSQANHVSSLGPAPILGSSLAQLGSEEGQGCEEVAPGQ